MEPIPETIEAVAELDALVYDDDLIDQLRASSLRLRELVPECVGMSVTMLDNGVTLTLAATDAETATLDAMQYLGGGPCIASVAEGDVVASDAVLLDEREWHLFAAASSASGVASTLSLPLLNDDGTVVGGVNLYATGSDCFDAHHEALADILGAWAGGAVRNADLSFQTRIEAQRAPTLLRDAARVETGTGVLAAYLHLSETTARQRLHAAAASVGLTPATVAQALVSLLYGPVDEDDAEDADA